MDVTLEGINPVNTRALLLACVTLLFSLHLWRWLRLLRQRSLSSPPGPPGPLAWPLVGNAPQLGNAPHLYFARMAKKYGNVFQIKLGSRTVVVLSGDSIKKALVKQGPEFAGRPDFTSFRYIGDGDSFAFGTITDLWKMHRRVAMSTIRMFSTGNPHTKRAFEHHVVCEIRELLQLFVGKTKEHRFFQPMAYLVVSTANIMSAVCFGKRYSYEDAEFQQVVGRNEQFTQTVGAGSIVDVMPWLQYFPNPIKTIFENFKNLNLEFTKFIREKVIEHRKTIQSSTIRDMTDAFIVAMDKLRDKSGLSSGKDFVTPIMGDIFGASQDTLSTSLQWIILILIKYPEMQVRLQQELGKVVDRNRLPSIEDQLQLPYIMAFIYEVMRFTSLMPLTIPHCTTRDTSIMGYAIPKDTVVFVNQWSNNHDSTLWSHPETFDPQRFLNQDGVLNKDLISSVLIFSLGKRRCIGEELSKLSLFLFTALIVHQCHITVDPARPVKLDSSYGLTLKPHPYSIAVTLRGDMTLLDAAARKEVEGEPSSDS
ncbi:cytochrome P450 1B1 isoform X2 [Sebastes umbrosus]|nr:cytochrome P450 1B1 isoform X2 [Sebastes umbrosus]XP_037637778.1 cytochrome P450 1B1 isoform X2 [Sebastes umbrosus]XP_037637779.1 cytochrome P450 1B1 isoform X2 [Sebastes umbrosus]